MKEPNAYVFTPENNHFKKLRREVITTNGNKVMYKVSRILSSQPNITRPIRNEFLNYVKI